MKTILLIIFSVTSFFISAQTTFDLDWELGVNGPDARFTIETGDTMRWTCARLFYTSYTVDDMKWVKY